MNGLADEPSASAVSGEAGVEPASAGQENVKVFMDNYFNMVRGPIINRKIVSHLKATTENQARLSETNRVDNAGEEDSENFEVKAMGDDFSNLSVGKSDNEGILIKLSKKNL